MYSILLVDDHQIMRDGLRTMLEATGEFAVVGEAETGGHAVALAARLRPHLVVMDLSLPGMNGIEATVELLRESPDSRVVILSMYDDESSVVQAMRSGARGFVLKKASQADLLAALRTVARGGTYLSPEVSDKFLECVRKGDFTRRTSSVLSVLTPRELQVARLIAEGKSSKEIAASLNLSVETVRGYRKTLMRKLGVNNVAALTQLAIAEGLTRSSHLGASQ
ncbi:MAG: response regulator transcription factor [Bryobacteraceae bacterium]|jgi:DNA-binding NarL/FixJ family response regulator